MTSFPHQKCDLLMMVAMTDLRSSDSGCWEWISAESAKEWKKKRGAGVELAGSVVQRMQKNGKEANWHMRAAAARLLIVVASEIGSQACPPAVLYHHHHVLASIMIRCWLLLGAAWLRLTILATCCNAAPETDRVVSLPLLGPPPTPHYSGYLDATAGCDTTVNGDSCQIHYWMALAEGDDWESKPVVLFLNGGPGSSSLLGFLQEVGPLLINATGGLMENPYSWNTVANLFVLESPVGVGFSYCAAQKEEGGLCQNTDKFTASASRAALADFFHTKFPELQGNDFFITGESYAGVYIPTLAYEILEYNHQNPTVPINLKGLAVGDPCTDNTAQRDSMDALWYGHKYGLVDEAVYDVLWNQCDVRLPNYLMHSKRNVTMKDLIEKYLDRGAPAPDCVMALRKFLLSTSRALSQGWRDMFIDDYSLFAPVTDAEDRAMLAYLNRPDVQTALHVQDAPLKTWPYPETGFDYTKEYDACNDDVEDGTPSMLDFYRKIVPAVDITWIYNGDTDPCVSYEGTRTAVTRIGFPEVDGGGYRPWFYNHTATSLNVLMEKAVMFGPDLLLQDTGAQFGGEVVNYQHNLTFLTVHGSGHMVPQFRPQAALHMLTRMIRMSNSDSLLAPLLPANATLSAMTDTEFSKAMDEWTESAKAAPFVTDTPSASKITVL